MYHYVYRITNKAINKHYYGVRTSKTQPKDDLGYKYFSSSTDKEFIKEQKSNPSIFKYKVVKICETRDEALDIEVKLHNRFNVAVNESFYNKAKQTSRGFDRCGMEPWSKGRRDLGGYKLDLTPEQRKVKSERQMGSKNHMYGKIPWQKGKKVTDVVKEKMRQTIGDSRKGENHPQYGKSVSSETKKKISDSLIGFKHEERLCPHCGVVGRGPNMTRYHFEKCRKLSKVV